MQSHQGPSEHDRERSRFAPSPLFELIQEEPAFTIYLDAACSPITRLAPEEWLRDLRAELAAHLECTAAAFEELGETRDRAVVKACRTLGDPVELGQRWKLHWETKTPEPFGQTLQLALREFSRATLLSVGMLYLSMYSILSAQPGGNRIEDCLRVAGVLVMPLIAGYRFACRSRGRRVRAAATALLLLALMVAVLGLVLPGSDPSGIRPFLWQMQLVYWLPLGCLSAGVTSLVQARQARRRKLSGS